MESIISHAKEVMAKNNIEKLHILECTHVVRRTEVPTEIVPTVIPKLDVDDDEED